MEGILGVSLAEVRDVSVSFLLHNYNVTVMLQILNEKASTLSYFTGGL